MYKLNTRSVFYPPKAIINMPITQSTDDAHSFYQPKIDIRIQSAEATQSGLEVLFNDEKPAQSYSWFWLKDHGIDSASLDHTTLQRKTDTFSIPHDLTCTQFKLDQLNQLIKLQWNDGQTSTVSAYILASVIGRTAAKHQLSAKKPQTLWDKDHPLAELPRNQYNHIISSDDALAQWLENIHRYGFSLVDDVPADRTSTKKLAERVGQIQQTLFGDMWELSSELIDHGDTAYSSHYLEPHSDGTYYDDAPGLQMFNCLEFDGKGGESIQVDGFAIAARIKREDPHAYQTLCEISVPAHYIEPGVHQHAERPAFRLDPRKNLIQVSFNNYDRAPFLLPDEESRRFHHAYRLLHKHVNDQDNWLKIALRPGTTLIFDNWRNLHGRMGYVGKRIFYGCYHSKAEFESKLRILQANRE